MAFLLVVVLACCCPALVRADLPVVDMAVAPEARSAAALLSPFLESQGATLCVVGSTRWTAAFLRGLSAHVPRVQMPIRLVLDDDLHPRLQHTLSTSLNALLVHTEGPEELLAAMSGYGAFFLRRTLFWTSVSSPQEDGVLRRVSKVPLVAPWLGAYQDRLALTSPNGSTVLYRLDCRSFAACSDKEVTITMVDEWSPLQGWRRQAAVFNEFCSGWRPGRGGRLDVVLLPSRQLTSTSPIQELAKTVVRLATRLGRGGPRMINITESDYYRLLKGLEGCRLDAMLTDVNVMIRPTFREASFVNDMAMVEVVAIVPAGFGAGVGVLEAVTIEFTAGLWCATGLALLSTAAVFACARRRQDVSGAVLQALAPVLGQATPPPAPPRPMLAAWLLACVVLTAAYQGLLLGKLSSAVPRRDLESLQDLEDSGLPVHMYSVLFLRASRQRLLPVALVERTRILFHRDISTAIDTVATARNCAVVVFMDMNIENIIRPYTIPPKQVHVIRLNHSAVRAIGMATKGSPLERPLVRALARVEAAGLLARWRSAEHERERLFYARKLVSLQGPRPLTLWQLGPALVVLGAGQVSGAVVFALELLCARWWQARAAGRTTRPGLT
ncbi:Ionotropic receptor 194 [Frankliniella occidentalis]|nr:Ionotropic receptor 194 [Frankliniella occidentalis]